MMMLINFIRKNIIAQNIPFFVKPHVGIPGKDVFYVPSYCQKCNRHFLIDGELKVHKRTY
jgi:hypothetical protein